MTRIVTLSVFSFAALLAACADAPDSADFEPLTSACDGSVVGYRDADTFHLDDGTVYAAKEIHYAGLVPRGSR